MTARAALVAAILAAGAVLGCRAAPTSTPTDDWLEHERGRAHHATTEPALAPVAGEPGEPRDPGEVGAPSEGEAAIQAARAALRRGDREAARVALARAAAAPDATAVATAHAELVARLAQPAVDPAKLAVLLPLSGKFAAIGRELRAAIQLAPAPGTRWLFLDTRGEVDGAVAAVDAAVAQGALAILGPVGAREATAAATAATARGVPIALLAPADGGDPAAGVFRLVDSPADEGRAVARLAALDNFPTVAVLAPRDEVGAESADAFVAEATRLGLVVAARGDYDPAARDLEPEVKAFLNLVPATNPRFAQHLARHGRKGAATFSPDIAFALLYLPDRHDRAALVAAYLPYFNVELRTTEFPDAAMLARKHHGVIPQVVQLVGGAGWHHPTLPVRGGEPVQGALIVDPYPADAGGSDLAAAFAAGFTSRTRRAPSGAAAQAHDAALLLARTRAALPATAGDPREHLRAALARASLDDGACGPAAIGGDGELRREPAVLEVQGDQLVRRP